MAITLSSILVFVTLFSAHLLAAFYAPIQDCDETFNFWEPSHYLSHGYGLQTWELSPVYAIRSWLYASIHSMLTYPARLLNSYMSKSVEFYWLRCIFAFVAAFSELRLYTAIRRSLNPRIAVLFSIVCASSAGIFHAAVAYLPSSFAMYTTTLALADFLDGVDGNKAWRAIVWLALGTIVGWPFVAVLAFPIAFEQLVSGYVNAKLVKTMLDLVKSSTYSLAILAIEATVDTLFYRKWTSVPLNIVKYNVFSRAGQGPNIYGTEPWHFYIRNLLINFNVWFILALLSLPLLLVLNRSTSLAASSILIFRNVMLTSPFYLWFTIFTIQPHKEERFMYPVYTCIALNAAIALHLILVDLSNTPPKETHKNIAGRLKLILTIGFVLSAVFLGIWRSAGLASAYSAPLSIYKSLRNDPRVVADPGKTFNVCVGKEWYRYPSSFHLPSNARFKFIKSDFSGLLPGEFSELPASSQGPFPSTWRVPTGMNDENIEDPSKYTNLEYCDFLVDSYFADRRPSPQEPDFVQDEKTWERVECLKFLDTAKSKFLARLFWIPDSTFIPTKWRRYWGDYCLLRKRF